MWIPLSSGKWHCVKYFGRNCCRPLRCSTRTQWVSPEVGFVGGGKRVANLQNWQHRLEKTAQLPTQCAKSRSQVSVVSDGVGGEGGGGKKLGLKHKSNRRGGLDRYWVNFSLVVSTYLHQSILQGSCTPSLRVTAWSEASYVITMHPRPRTSQVWGWWQLTSRKVEVDSTARGTMT